MDQYHQPAANGEEISLKDLIIGFQSWCKSLLGKWHYIAVSGALFAGLGFLYASLKSPQYKAELTFVLEEGKSGTLGGYAGLAAQFGFDLGSSGGGGVFAGDNILEFLRSRLMVERTLLTPVMADGRRISLATLYAEKNELTVLWNKKDRLKNAVFPPLGDRNGFSIVQDSLLNVIYMEILKRNLKVSKPDKKLSFIAVSCTSNNEIFSKLFTERLVTEATDFYVRTKTKRSKINVDKLQAKADSIEDLLNRKTYSMAASADLNLNPARNVARVGTELINRDKMVLQTMYAEVVKNLEVSRMSMSQETPIIQIVDSPIFPLKREGMGKLKGLVLGGLLGGMLIFGWLVIKDIYRKIMA